MDDPPETSVHDSFDTLIVSGGDERLALDDSGRNKYHLDPRSSTGTLHRGSCTCSPINPEARAAASAVHERLRAGETSVSELLDLQRERLLDIFVAGPHDGAGVIFAPSGSDLCYLPLMFSELLEPGRRIVNVVATSEELGSGSLLAHDGRFFAEISQLTTGLAVGAPLTDDLDVEMVALPARDASGGIVDQTAPIEQLIAQRDPGDALIVNLVIGSKSGIENGLRIIERFAGDDIIWTVDLCQMRARPALFEHLLDLGCFLFCTGSKFYEAPPFCGAMLVPDQWMKRLADADGADLSGFDQLFASGDFPSELTSMSSALVEHDNIGVCLRWEAALFEMEAFDAIDEEVSAAAIAEWHRVVVERLESSANIDLLGDQDRTNDSIISFRVADARGGYLDRAGLAEIHRRLMVDGAPEIAPFERATIGQPVSYESGSFLRLALGSGEARRFSRDGVDATMDVALVDAIESIGRSVALEASEVAS